MSSNTAVARGWARDAPTTVFVVAARAFDAGLCVARTTLDDAARDTEPLRAAVGEPAATV